MTKTEIINKINSLKYFTEDLIVINRIVNCITHREKFNLGAYTSLRKAIIKKMYIVAHLEWGYEENEK